MAMMMHRRLPSLLCLALCSFFYRGDASTAIRIHTHGLVVVSTRITRTFHEQSSLFVPQWTLVIEEASVKDVCDASNRNNSSSLLYLEEPLQLDSWQCNNTLCEANATTTFVVPLCQDIAEEEEEALTRTLVVTLWQHERPSYRRPLTRRLATLPKATRPQHEISPVAKVTMIASSVENQPLDPPTTESPTSSRKVNSTTIKEWISSLFWIIVCFSYYLREWRRDSLYADDRRMRLRREHAWRNSALEFQDHNDSSSFSQVPEDPLQLQSEDQHSHQQHGMGATWEVQQQEIARDQLVDSLQQHSVATMDESATDSQGGDMHPAEVDPTMEEHNTTFVSEQETEDNFESVRKWSLQHQPNDDGQVNSVHDEVQHLLVIGATTEVDQQNAAPKDATSIKSEEDNDSSDSIDKCNEAQAPTTTMEEATDRREEATATLTDTYEKESSLPTSIMAVSLHTRDGFGEPGMSSKQTRNEAHSQSENDLMTSAARREDCDSFSRGCKDVADDTKCNPGRHQHDVRVTRNPEPEMSKLDPLDKKKTPSDSSIKISTSMKIGSSPTSNDHDCLGQSKYPQKTPGATLCTAESLPKKVLRSTKDLSENIVEEQSSPSLVRDQIGNGTGRYLPAFAQNLTWLRPSPRRQRTSEVLTQFSDGPVIHLDKLAGSYQKMDVLWGSTNPMHSDRVQKPAEVALATAATRDDASFSESYVSTLPPDSDYCSAADEEGTSSPRESASKKMTENSQEESDPPLFAPNQADVKASEGQIYDHFTGPPVVHKPRPKMQKLLSRKRYRCPSNSESNLEPQLPTPSKKPRPFENSKIVPDWVPSNRLQTASKQFSGEEILWETLAPVSATSAAKKRSVPKRSFDSQTLFEK